MKVMVFVKATADTEAGELPSRELIEEMTAYNEELAEAGVILAGDGLHPSSRGARVHFDGEARTVTDGPFAETKELVAGYWIWQVGSLDAAVEWAKRCPNPTGGEGALEIRPIYEVDDLGEAFTPELRERDERMRTRIAGDR
jgi:hypothetical protein